MGPRYGSRAALVPAPIEGSAVWRHRQQIGKSAALTEYPVWALSFLIFFA
jgi:hypothetical protein